MGNITSILEKSVFQHDDIVALLDAKGDDAKELFAYSASVKEKYVGNFVYFRGLVEFSNVCGKNCLYCGIRKGNRNFKRYNLSDEDILKAAEFAYTNNYGSVVLQSGELENNASTARIEKLVRDIKHLSDGRLGITLSVGEQSYDTYKRWFDAGAHRFLLRIEASGKELYYKIHPNDSHHTYEKRLQALNDLKTIGYQVGTGVMIGLPWQTTGDLADDLLFMKEFDIDMCGMGPYIEHPDTPLYEFRDKLLPLEERFQLALKMIAVLRILMKDINIAAATALQAIDPIGREKAVKIGANVIMPNITPGLYRNDYKLYNNKPCTSEEAADCSNCLDARIAMTGNKIGYGEWGDSAHFKKKKESL
jgi:biotin synthase